ncbi:MAG: hypothetical protein HY303_04740 [Candidatus Wallbacteria bacterium]|nr:hypothetical protein [Candidatus Wallbacteria bacterium]
MATCPRQRGNTRIIYWLLTASLLSGCNGGTGGIATTTATGASLALPASGAAVFSALQDANPGAPGVQTDLVASLGPTASGLTFGLFSTTSTPPSQPESMSLAAQATADWQGNVTFRSVTVFDGQRLEVRNAFGTRLLSTQMVLNRPPTVNAGPDQTVEIGTPVSLTGTAVDPEGQTLTFQWTLVPPVAGASVTSVSSLRTPVQLPGIGSYVFRLTARDPFSEQASDDVQVTVTALLPPNHAPTATVARAESTLAAGAAATISGGGTDPDGDRLSYEWTKLSGPAATLTNVTSSQLTITPADGLYQLQLRVSDPRGASSTAQVSILGVAVDGAAQADIDAATRNAIAFHSASASKSIQACKYCHGAVLTSRALNPSIETVHYRHHLSPTGPQLGCTDCHVSIDLLTKSAAHVRRQVAMNLCVGCHGTRFFAVRNLNK